MFKKVIVLVALVLVMALAFGACGNGNQDAGADAGYEGLSGDFFFWIHEEALGAPLAAAFGDLHPNLNVDWEQVGFTDQRAMMTLDGPAGIGPDVFVQPHDGVAIAINDGIVEPFPADLQQRLTNLILPSAINTTSRGGRLYGAPFQTENIALFYNRDYVPVPPSTFEEILDFAREWNDPAQNRFAMRWQVADAYHNYPFLNAFGFTVFGPNMDDWQQMDWDGEAVRRGLEFHNQFRQYFDFATEDVTWDSSVAAFQRGEAAFTISGPWAIADARNNGINFGITRLPTMGGTQPRVFSGAGIAHVSSFSTNKDAAFAFVEFLATEQGAQILYDVMGTLTALYDISGIPGLRDDPWLMGIQEQAPYSDPMPTIPEVDFMWVPLESLFTHSWNRSLSIPDAQALAMDEYRNLLAAAGLTWNR